jgi:hypothetical protein
MIRKRALLRVRGFEPGIRARLPPPDPLGGVDPEKARRFTLASGINELWKVASSGKKVDENLEGWSKVIGTLTPYAVPMLNWLRGLKLPQGGLSQNSAAAGARERI